MTHQSSTGASSGASDAPKKGKRPPKFSPLLKAGWEVIPFALVRTADGKWKKQPLVRGYHGDGKGKGHKVADRVTVQGWARDFPKCHPGLVLPPGVVGFDVDGASHGEGVDGLGALKAFEEKFGPLPETGHIFHGYTEDGSPNPYGTRLYRVPDSMLELFRQGNVHGDLDTVTGIDGIDIIAPWLRFNAAPGAKHPTGETYEWSARDSLPEGYVLPNVSDLPVLTERHMAGVLKRTTKPAAKKIVGVESAPTTVPELLGLVRELSGLGLGERITYRGKRLGWQEGDGFYTLACAIARLSKDREKAKKAFVKAAEAVGDDYDIERQWDNAVAVVEAEEEGLGLDNDQPYPVAVNVDPYRFVLEMLDREFRNEDGVLTLRYSLGDQRFWLWNHDESRYRPLANEEVTAWVGQILLRARETGPDATVRPVNVKPATVENVVRTLKPLTLVSVYGAGALLGVSGGVPFRNGWLDIQTGEFTTATPARFITWSLPVEYDAEAFSRAWKPEDTPLWSQFLRSIKFLDSRGRLTDRGRLLRQMYGYVLSGSNKHHKFFLLHGRRRAGKGVTLTVLEELVGGLDVGAVTFDYDTLNYNHGVAGLVGRRLIYNDDLKFTDRNSVMPRRAVENFVKIASNGPVEANPKGKDPHSVRLDAVLVAATNDPPRWKGQASDAIPGRMIALEYTETFFGHEDKTLNKRLRAEYAGIVRFALDGWAELERQDAFTEPEGMEDTVNAASIESSPVRGFAATHLVLDPDETSPLDMDAVYDMYESWSTRNGFPRPLDKPTFEGDLDTVLRDLGAEKKPRRIGGRNARTRKVWVGVTLLSETEAGR